MNLCFSQRVERRLLPGLPAGLAGQTHLTPLPCIPSLIPGYLFTPPGGGTGTTQQVERLSWPQGSPEMNLRVGVGQFGWERPGGYHLAFLRLAAGGVCAERAEINRRLPPPSDTQGSGGRRPGCLLAL